MFKKVLGRNIIWWAMVLVVLSFIVNWRMCTIERGRYLLGIFYNGHYQNTSDGVVYQDYLKTHGITHEFISNHV